MFEREELINFVGKIINQSSQKEETKRNLEQFRSYLDLTKMADEKNLCDLDQVIDCTDELLAIKEKIGNCDITSLIDATTNIKEKKKVKREKETIHYHNYHSDPCTSSKPSYWSTGCSGQRNTYRGGC